jgi:RNA polymerase sigma factor (sigma-70 family)
MTDPADQASAAGGADAEVRLALERACRTDHGRLVAALTRRFGASRLELCENAVQEAMLRALERWPRDGTPASPDGWLLRVAHNAAVDALRREVRMTALPSEQADEPEVPTPALDDELLLMFLCCHPALPRAAQVALTLKVACGFSTPQIAQAFLTEEKTLAQRLARAKQRLRQEEARFELPETDELPARLAPILDVLYLVFNEGHSPTSGETAIEEELCSDALRLARLLTSLPPTATPEAEALRALLCFQAARAPARRADDGSLLLLQEQDRARWDAALIEEGFAALGRAGRGDALSRFHLEAGIAACHAVAPSYAATDWPQVVFLYDVLRARAPSPIVEVNRAIAIAMASGALAGLDELDAIPERDLIARYPYALAAYAELHASLDHLEEARSYLDRALANQPSRPQRQLLERKRAALDR